MFVTYEELLTVFRDEVSKIDNLKEFCRNNGFEKNYNLIVQINKGHAPRKYSVLIIKFLKSLNYAIEKQNVYSIERITHGKDATHRKHNGTHLP